MKITILPILIAFHELCIYLANDMCLPILFDISDSYNVPKSYSQLILLAWFIGSGILQMFLGPIVNYYGAKKIFVTGHLVFLFGTGLCIISTDFYMLLFSRFLQGLTLASMIVAGYSEIHTRYSTAQVLKILSFTASIGPISSAFGPLLSVLIVSISGSWKTVFRFLFMWNILSLVLCIFYYKSTNHTKISPDFKKTLVVYYEIIKNRKFLAFTLLYCLSLNMICIWVIKSPEILLRGYGKSELYFSLAQIMVSGFSSVIGGKINRTLIQYFRPQLILRNAFKVVLLLSCCLLILVSIRELLSPEVFLTSFLAGLIILFTSLGSIIGFLNRFAIQSSNNSKAETVAMFSAIASLSLIITNLIATTNLFSSVSLVGIMILLYATSAFILFFSLADKYAENQ